MSERLTIRLDNTLHARVFDAAQQRGEDLSTLVRQALVTYLEGISEAREVSTPLPADTAPTHGPTVEDCVSPASAPQTSVTSEAGLCVCCEDNTGRCTCWSEDWCATCFRCVQHCPHEA